MSEQNHTFHKTGLKADYLLFPLAESIQTTEIYATVSQALLNKTLRERNLPSLCPNGETKHDPDLIPDYLTGLAIGIGAVAVTGGGYFLMRRKRHA